MSVDVQNKVISGFQALHQARVDGDVTRTRDRKVTSSFQALRQARVTGDGTRTRDRKVISGFQALRQARVTGDGTRARDRRNPADLRAGSLSTVPQMPPPNLWSVLQYLLSVVARSDSVKCPVVQIEDTQ
ncbi:hypothetical protein PoB_000545300 [Plakobranchus ocellatus]|uniref:Uncharacterized protein n=1 Tax=Plakobranchus ocellatus TaxID=259542 RepID=A0AAV3Y8W3_9GAST|nr:hypothetical protein PoB_000545300 [Plakobranchus ocellatus]